MPKPKNTPKTTSKTRAPPPKASAPARTQSGYMAAAAARGQAAVAGDVSKYSRMLLDPLSRDAATRYPDETIVPTALTHLTASTTYTVDDAGTVFTASRWKVTDLESTSVPVLTQPQALGLAPEPGTGQDYGGPQAAWSPLCAIDRTLSFGIKVRLVALPTSTFLPSGTLYFLQVQQDEGPLLPALRTGEQAAIQAVTAGKGFSMTVNELSKMDGAVIPFLPQGPMSFVFSDHNSAAAAGQGSATVLSANPSLWVVGYGMEAGLKLRFDYAHHVEYIPTVQAAGLVATRVQPPSSAAREGIAKASQIVQNSLAGATSGAEVARLVSPGAALGSIAAGLGRAAMGLIPGSANVLRGAGIIASGLGAPAWLQSAIAALA